MLSFPKLPSRLHDKKRVVLKDGEGNIILNNKHQEKHNLQTLFTILVNTKWRLTMIAFATNFVTSWFLIGIIWYIISYFHGDIDYFQQLKIFESNGFPLNNSIIEKHEPCVTEIYSFYSAFLFSLETQHTIGYGHRFVTEECPEAIFMLCFQSILGFFLQAFMVGVVFAKLARPKKRARTLIFSKTMVVCQRNGKLCLMFRVADLRKNHIIETHVRAQLIRKKITKEGEFQPFFQQNIQLGADGVDNKLMFIWPTTIIHKIDEHSPLYTLSAEELSKEHFEIVVVLEGIVESTGIPTQARTSYLSSEILWGQRFDSAVLFKSNSENYEIDYTLFNATYTTDTPMCSAKDLNSKQL